MTLKVETHPNAEIRTYHSRVEISDTWEHVERGFALPESAVLKLILGIPGVQSIISSSYTLQVTKGVAFSWSEIEPRILEILEPLQICARS